MRRLKPETFSAQYDVRLLNRAHVPEIFALYASNPQYFSSCADTAEPAHVLRDMSLLPPGKTSEEKYYAGYFLDGNLVAVLDLIDGYPDARTAYIGFFCVHGALSRRGIGSLILSELFACLRGEGFSTVRLGYDPKNPQASAFWVKNGFRTVQEIPYTHPSGMQGTMAVAERRL